MYAVRRQVKRHRFVVRADKYAKTRARHCVVRKNKNNAGMLVAKRMKPVWMPLQEHVVRQTENTLQENTTVKTPPYLAVVPKMKEQRLLRVLHPQKIFVARSDIMGKIRKPIGWVAQPYVAMERCIRLPVVVMNVVTKLGAGTCGRRESGPPLMFLDTQEKSVVQ